MPEYTPAAAACGVPDSRPVLVLNVAQLGRFWMLYVSVSPSASAPLGWKVYAEPALTLVAGVPEIVGARFAAALTVIANGASDTPAASPSLTVMTMPLNVPTFWLVGVPDRRPVPVLNVAQLGMFAIVKPSVSLSASAALGVNEYAVPAVTLVGGVPLIVGARFGGACTLIANAGSAVDARPSLTEITMFA